MVVFLKYSETNIQITDLISRVSDSWQFAFLSSSRVLLFLVTQETLPSVEFLSDYKYIIIKYSEQKLLD